ncbi:Ankyrin repeat [Dillenia turbinata]|uniref:RING-type E3 ubiquitin transferase n=1 Tax=Dillenia turbinata TaxID=194707 RepID=A0AAN8ZQF0_9MAGN
MGQSFSCSESEYEIGLLRAIQDGEIKVVADMIEEDSSVLEKTTFYDRLSALHVAAAHGQIQILSMLLDRSVGPDTLNRRKQTPLMLAAMHGKIACVRKLIQEGANILMFDSRNRRTCLHYAAYYGHSDCLQAILSAARSSDVAASWGFARFVNIRDKNGMTPLHLAARRRHPSCVHTLLDNGALVCSSTGGSGYPGSTPLHMAARGGSIDCVRELLAWGADRLQIDTSGRIPYFVALRHKYGACAALLNPSSAAPLVWPAALKFISELSPEAKTLLECALREANKEKEKAILNGTVYSQPFPDNSDVVFDDTASEASNIELCCICFDQVCTIEVQDCGHQMCAHCTLALCCHKKPDCSTVAVEAPVCPFCRSTIKQLAVAETKIITEVEVETGSASKPRKSKKSINFSEGSSSFKSLTSLGSFGKLGGRKSSEMIDKP